MEQRLYFRNTNIDCVRPQFTITYNKERIKGFAIQTVFLFMVILIARTKKLGTVILNSLGGKNMIFHNFCRFFHGVHLMSLSFTSSVCCGVLH